MLSENVRYPSLLPRVCIFEIFNHQPEEKTLISYTQNSIKKNHQNMIPMVLFFSINCDSIEEEQKQTQPNIAQLNTN